VSDERSKIPGDRQEEKRAVLMDPFDKPALEIVRFSMYRDMDVFPPDVSLPFGYRAEPWVGPLIPAFAASMAVAFADSSELETYPRLSSREGCQRIVEDICNMPDFLSGATWLVFFNREPCGFILCGQAKKSEIAQIRIFGVAPRHRRFHIGSWLVNRALWAFHDRKFPQAMLNVNRTNHAGVRFLRSLGFYVAQSREYLLNIE